MATSINDMITDVIAALVDVDGIGEVENRWGGTPRWEKLKAPCQAYWVITWSGYGTSAAGIGLQVFRQPTLRVRGWMPFSYEKPDSTPVWYTLVDGVIAALRGHRSICQNLGLPQIVMPPDTVELAGSKDEVACHHVEIDVTAKEHTTYTTT